LGAGISSASFAFDIAYQYRFGEKDKAESMQGEDVSGKDKEHYFYSSLIVYF